MPENLKLGVMPQDAASSLRPGPERHGLRPDSNPASRIAKATVRTGEFLFIAGSLAGCGPATKDYLQEHGAIDANSYKIQNFDGVNQSNPSDNAQEIDYTIATFSDGEPHIIYENGNNVVDRVLHQINIGTPEAIQEVIFVASTTEKPEDQWWLDASQRTPVFDVTFKDPVSHDALINQNENQFATSFSTIVVRDLSNNKAITIYGSSADTQNAQQNNPQTVGVVLRTMFTPTPDTKAVETTVPSLRDLTPVPPTPVGSVSPEPDATVTASPSETPSTPMIEVDGVSLPDPKVTNPELFSPTYQGSPVFEFAKSMGLTPEEVIANTHIVVKDVHINRILTKKVAFLVTSDMPSTQGVNEDGYPLLMATQENGEWKWQSATLDNVAKNTGWKDFGALLVFNDNAKQILENNFGAGLVYIDWNYVQPQEGQWDFSDPRYNVDTAFSNGMDIRGNLIWGKGNVASWVRQSPDVHSVMIDYITHVMNQYRNKIKVWDVYNEANRKGQDVFWNKLGLQGVRDAFSTARSIDPSATLLYNDFIDVDGTESEDRMAMIDKVVPALVQDGNIDGLGIQIIVNRMSTFNPDKLKAQIAKLKQYNLPIRITEFSIVIHGANTPQNLQKQAEIGGEIIQILRDSGIVVDMTAFGVDDGSANKIYGDNSNAGFWMTTEDGTQVPKPVVWEMMREMVQDNK